MSSRRNRFARPTLVRLDERIVPTAAPNSAMIPWTKSYALMPSVPMEITITNVNGGVRVTQTNRTGSPIQNSNEIVSNCVGLLFDLGDRDDIVRNNSTVPVFVRGKGGNDALYGGSAGDKLFGGDGDDTLVGNGGGDYLDGGNGADRLTGGAGVDAFDTGNNQGDIVTDPESVPTSGGGGGGGSGAGIILGGGGSGGAEITFGPAQPSMTLSLSPTSYSVWEGAAGTTTTVRLTVRLDSAVRNTMFMRTTSGYVPAHAPVSVTFATANGSAVSGSDYAGGWSRLTFAANEWAKTIDITVYGDNAVENNEWFTGSLSQPTGAAVSGGSTVVWIFNDDLPPPLPTTHAVLASDNGAGGLAWAAAVPGHGRKALPTFGFTGDQVVIGDFDGNGRQEQGVARSNAGNNSLEWYLDLNGDGFLGEQVVSFGWATDKALAADVNGDGKTDLIAVRNDTATNFKQWFVDLERNGYNGETPFHYGWVSDTAVVGDWNGDGRADFGVTRLHLGFEKWWYLNTDGDSGAEKVFRFGNAGDLEVTGRWTTAAAWGFAVARPKADGSLEWYFDINGDGKTDWNPWVFGRVGDKVVSLRR